MWVSSSRCRRIPRIHHGVPRFFREDGSADTHELLGNMTRTIKRTFKHVSRHDKDIQPPVRTPIFSAAAVVVISPC